MIEKLQNSNNWEKMESGKRSGYYFQDKWKNIQNKEQEQNGVLEQNLHETQPEKINKNHILEGTLNEMRLEKINKNLYPQAKNTEDVKDTEIIKSPISEEAIQQILQERNKAPYSMLADENGTIDYKGVIFQCDYKKNELCLGDMSKPDNILDIPMEKGGVLKVNRDNLDGLIKAIGMFSPEDINRIMRAIAADAKLRQTQIQIEDETSGIKIIDKKNQESIEDRI
ncbi:MAG: hypothetical protein RR139_06200 [Lachnospiraceae bacterium]